MKRCGPLRPFRAWYLIGFLLSQGVALGYHIKPRWGRGPTPRCGRGTHAPSGLDVTSQLTGGGLCRRSANHMKGMPYINYNSSMGKD
jgi:hypothetical protein